MIADVCRRTARLADESIGRLNAVLVGRIESRVDTSRLVVRASTRAVYARQRVDTRVVNAARLVASPNCTEQKAMCQCACNGAQNKDKTCNSMSSTKMYIVRKQCDYQRQCSG